MADNPATRGLLHTLAALRPGQPALFVLAREAGAGFPPLLVQPGERDDAPDRLVTMVSALPDARGPVVSGSAWFDDDGVLVLHSDDMTAERLGLLASWVRDAAPTNPRLGLLAGTRFRRTDPFGGPPEVVDRPGLWEGIAPVRPRRAGGVGAAADALRALEPGDVARMWLPRAGRGLVVLPRTTDTTGALYRAAVKEAKTLGLDPGRSAIQCIVRRLATGRLVVAGSVDARTLTRAVGDLVLAQGPDNPALWELADARCVRLDGAEVGEGATAFPAPDLSLLGRVLPQLAKGQASARAHFAVSAGGGLPSLTLARSAAELEAQTADSDGIAARGVLRFGARGPEFVTERPFRDLEAHLAGWSATWQRACPALRHLASCAVVLASPGGERRQEPDPALWRPLTWSRA